MFQTVFNRLRAQAVALIHAVRQVKIRLPAQGAEHLQQQGGGGHAVHIVIAENHERFVLFAGAEQPFHGHGHVRQQKRVGQVFKARLQEGFNRGRFAEVAIEQALGQER